jgi:hypothetical protein
MKTNKPIKKWTYEELMQYCAWIVVERMTKGEDLLGGMSVIFNIIECWKRENKIK